jgi:anti-sigma regulatory factor (Ser/Thr protein kinase)
MLVSGGASAELREKTALVVAELVTNAVQAAGRCSLTAWHLADLRVVRIEVVDTSLVLPAIQPIDVGRIGGHGLRIVDAVATRWGVTGNADRKSVWAELDG